MDAKVIPIAMVNKHAHIFQENASNPKASPQKNVKMGAIPLRIVPKDTVNNSKAKFEQPISRAVMTPIGST